MHIFCLSTLALESLNGATFKAPQKDSMMNALFVQISGNIDAEEQGLITYTVFYSVFSTKFVFRSCPLMDFKMYCDYFNWQAIVFFQRQHDQI